MFGNIEKTFYVSSPVFLSVSNIRGSVEIHSGEDGILQVTAIKQPLKRDEKRTGIGIFQEAGGTFKAITYFPDSGRIDCSVPSPAKWIT